MDEEADLALLDQHLLKTNLLSQRMTTILAQLDTRLSRLDKTIAPLGIQPLTRKAYNIDALLATLEGSSGSGTGSGHAPTPSITSQSSTRSRTGNPRTQPKGYSLEPIPSAPGSGVASPADESAILARGPDIMALGEFTNAFDSVAADLDRMYRGFKEGRGGAREAGIRDLSKLVEAGFSGLMQLFLKLAREGTGKTCDPDAMIRQGTPTPPNYFAPLQTLIPLTTFVAKYASQQSYTQSIIQPILDDAMNSFAQMRGEWMVKSFRGMLVRVEEVDEGGIWEGGRGKEKVAALIDLWDAMPIMVEAETLLITTLFPSAPSPSLLPATLAAPLAAIISTIQPTISTIKRSLSTHTFLALELYTALISAQSTYEHAATRCLEMAQAPRSAEILTPLSPVLSTLRSLVLRSFPEMLVDIRTTSGTGNTSGIADTTYSVLTYIETLPAYEKTVENLLGKSHSERSWLMGAKDAPSPVRSASEEGGIVNLFVADVLGTLLSYLEQRAKPMRKPVGPTFLLNNLSHIRNTTSGLNSDIIGPGAEDMMNKGFRDAKNQYLAEWVNLLGLLSSPQQSSRLALNPERTTLKEMAATFFDRLGDMENTTNQYPFARNDPDLRERIGREVETMVRDGYGSFWSKAQGKGIEKYLRGSPDEVVKRVQTIFR